MAEISLMHAQMLVNIEREQQAQAKKIKMIEAKVSTINTEYYSLSGYHSLIGKRWILSKLEAQQVGKELKALSTLKGFEVFKVYDAKFSTVNTYHVEVLEEGFSKLSLLNKDKKGGLLL